MAMSLEKVWRKERSSRVAFLVDGAAYFDAFLRAIERARHSILILSWDIDSRTILQPQEPGVVETPLIETLNKVVAEKKGLHAHLLNWDYAPIYAFERESVPKLRFRAKKHPRVHFTLDADHPYCASHHQKVVVVDDAIAFCGGLDLTTHRWDTPDHRPDDPRRRDLSSELYTPFHDVQIAVDGDAARALGELARERWFRATGKRLSQPPREGGDPWPEELAVDLRDVEVGIARTEPPYRGREAVREVEATFVDSIRAAKRYVYAETQYLSSSVIRDVIRERLAEVDGPEIVLVKPRECSGWMEKQTMGVITARLVRELETNDQHQRLRVLAPVIGDVDVFVHSKVTIIDDRSVRVGSANLSNRSMGVDTECDLLIESDEPRVCEGIVRFRDRLLSEHLGSTPEQVGAAYEREGSLIKAIESLSGGERTLVKVECDTQQNILIPEEIADPLVPFDSDQLALAVVPDHHRRTARRRAMKIGLAFAALVGLALAWRFTPLAGLIDLQRMAGWGAEISGSPLAPLIVVVVYAVGTTLMVPVNLLLLATGMIFGPMYGALYALLGSLTGAATGYGVGRAVGADAVRSMLGPRGHRLLALVHRRGLIAFTTVRLVPIASFGLVNMLGGAMRVRFLHFMIGTLIGLTPGITITVLFGGELADLITSSDRARQWPVVGVALGGLVVVSIVLGLVGRKLVQANPRSPGGRLGEVQ